MKIKIETINGKEFVGTFVRIEFSNEIDFEGQRYAEPILVFDVVSTQYAFPMSQLKRCYTIPHAQSDKMAYLKYKTSRFNETP